MELSGSTIVPYPRDVVWQSLFDAETIRRSISGCIELDWISENELQGKIKKKFGPVKATFPINLSVSDVVQFESYTMQGSSKGGSFGYVNGEADFKLVDVDEGCELFYEAGVKMGGKLAQIGSRLMSSAAKKIVGDFFEAFFAEIESQNSPETDEEKEPD